MEKPDNLSTKAPDDVEDSEFADIVRERNKQTAARAPQAGGITGAGPTHWYENYDAKNSRLWLIVDPREDSSRDRGCEEACRRTRGRARAKRTRRPTRGPTAASTTAASR